MTKLATIAEGERLLAAYTEACAVGDGVVESAAGDAWQAWLFNNAPALLAVARAAANHVVGSDHDSECRADRGCVCGKLELEAALDRLTPENPDAT